MKKLLCFLLTIVLLFGCAAAEEAAPVFHSAFGLTQESSREEIADTIISVFSAEQSRHDSWVFITKDEVLYGLPIKYVTIHVSSDFNMESKQVEIFIDDEKIKSEDLLSMYRNLCEEFGDPTVTKITTDVVTMAGRKSSPLEIEDTKNLQEAWDRYNLSGLICWDNISLDFDSASYTWEGSRNYYKKAEVKVALSTDSLEWEVRELYGLLKDP